MKKVVIALVICVLSTGAFAEGFIPEQTAVAATQYSISQAKDGYLMQDGKMYVVKNGEAAQMAENVTLENGTVVTTEGKVTPKEGEAVTLKDGQYVDLQGNIKTWENPS